MANKLLALQKFLGSVPERQDVTQSERVILETFEAIYGKALWDPTEPDHKANNDAGYKRVTHILRECSTDIEYSSKPWVN